MDAPQVFGEPQESVKQRSNEQSYTLRLLKALQ
jgi:hypothetical protein